MTATRTRHPLDWSHTEGARRDRIDKAGLLAAWCEAQGHAAARVTAWEPKTRRAAERSAGARRSSDETWALTVKGLTCWEQGHCAGDEEHPCLPRPASPPTTEGEPLPVDTAPPSNVGTPARRSKPAEQDLELPRGWAELTALGPVTPPQPCGVHTTPGAPCGLPAIVLTLMHAGPDTWRCALHPPTGNDWGTHLNWTPSPCLHPARCVCGRHPTNHHTNTEGATHP